MKGAASAFVLLERDITFLDETYKPMTTSIPFPLALVYVGSRTNEFLDLSSDLGLGCVVKNYQPQNKKPSFCVYCGQNFIAKRSTAKYCGTTCRVEAYRQRTKS